MRRQPGAETLVAAQGLHDARREKPLRELCDLEVAVRREGAFCVRVSISWWQVTVIDLLNSEVYDGLMITALPVIMAGTILAHAIRGRLVSSWTREAERKDTLYQS